MSFPNEEQLRVINSLNSKLVVIAAPGTGKTSAIVARMVSLLKSDSEREISFITFTRSSRRDTQSKMSIKVGDELLSASNIELPRISTLHTYAKSIIHKNAKHVGRNANFSILIKEKGEENLILSEIIDDLKLDLDLEKLSRDIFHFRSKNYWHSTCIIPPEKRGHVYEHLELLQQFYNTFDLQGLVSYACELIEKKRAKIPTIFLQVDEYQDLNPVEQKLISLLSRIEGSKIVVVGDDAQSIYGFRHANPDGIRDLWNSDDWENIPLLNCHRIPAHILRAALSLIKDENYIGGNVNKPIENGKLISTLQCTKPKLQIKAVAKSIEQNIKERKNSDGDKISYSDIMVLCPYSIQTKQVAETLSENHSIPTKQPEENIIPDDHWRLLLILRMLENKDSLALRQWLQLIGISNKKITKYRNEAMEKGDSLYQYCSKVEEQEIIDVYSNLLLLHDSINDLEMFRNLLFEFPHLDVELSLFSDLRITINEATQRPHSINSVINYIYEKFGLLDRVENNPDDNAVLVTTMHSAKGLEAEIIYIMWLNDTFLPGVNRNVSEERRVFYVALTRAKQDLILTFYEKYNPSTRRLLKQEAMSPFLKDIISHLDIKRITASDLK